MKYCEKPYHKAFAMNDLKNEVKDSTNIKNDSESGFKMITFVL